MKLVGYIRVSRVNGREGESFISPKLQRESIESYANVHGHEIVKWAEPDLDQPGSKLERPGLQQALAWVKAGEADGIIAAKLDRLTRSVGNLGKLLEDAKAGGWNLIAVDLGLDFSTSNGKLVANVLGSVAEWELDRRRESWDDAQANAVQRGVHVASKTPTGYARNGRGQLVPNPKPAKVVREIFRRRAAGTGWTALADYMTASRIITPYGNATWTPSAVAKLIRNPVYKGEARAGRHRNANAHEPLVTRAEWEAAQLEFSTPEPRGADAPLLSGLVRCASCRYVMKGESMRNRGGEQLAFHRCRRRHAAGECPNPASILARVLDPYVEQRFLAALRPHGVLAVAQVATDDLEEALRDLEWAEAEIEAYNSATSVAEIGADLFRRGVAKRAHRVEEARQRIAEVQRSTGASALPPPQELLEAWPTLSKAEKRVFLAGAIDAVVVWPVRGKGRQVSADERVTIAWRGEAPVDLPTRGRRVDLAPWPA